MNDPAKPRAIERGFPPEDRSSWRSLLDLALPALDYVFPSVSDPKEKPPWTLGGGTALAMTLQHRISHDIDIFVSAKGLQEFTPQRNPKAALISSKFQWPGHYLKFERPEGEIDFLSAHLLTEPGFTLAHYKGREIAVETPEEIIAKKIRYRGAKFTPRDAFDLAAAGRALPNLPTSIAQHSIDMIDTLRDALVHLQKQGPEAFAASVAPTPNFEFFAETAVSECLNLLNEVNSIARRALRPPQAIVRSRVGGDPTD